MAIKVRDFEVRLTRNKEERKQVRQLRYKIFVEEEGAIPTKEQQNLREEYDAYDNFAEYMAVFHKNKVVGTYRIIGREAAEKMGGFYTETEFDIKKIKKVRGNIAEMSRACVDTNYREGGLVMRMLWMGMTDYILKRKIVLMFGVASWVGTQPAHYAQAISYLYYNHLAPISLRPVVAVEKLDESVNPKLTRMNILPKDFVDKALAKSQMTPLVKGYLRLGAQFGKGVFIDKQFNTSDVFVILQTKNMNRAYQKHFTGNENAFDHLVADDGAMKKFGKVMLLPFTGSIALFKAAAQFFLFNDADDAEIIEEENNGK
ncbi:MAG: GNAT family N-acetyltransferase [Alphaproteobacteria bacterium]|jgi:putative hemolysin|nr:GNAT family N-acetyltransferase [Alphaproteobacteria bacterium]